MKRHIGILFLLSGMAYACLLTTAMAQSKAPATERPGTRVSVVRQALPGYFPLEVGNEWVYTESTEREAAGGFRSNTFKIKVLRETMEANGRKYFEIAGWFHDDPDMVFKVRQTASGEIFEYNPDGIDFLWYRWNIAQGEWILKTAEYLSCISDSIVIPDGSAETVVVPAGTFANTRHLSFRSRCADGGILEENFARGVGLVRRVEETFIGPRTYRLVSARIGSQQFPVASYGIQVSMDRPIYFNNLMPPINSPWPTAHVMLAIKNRTQFPIEFMFPTSQRFDFVVSDATGNEVLRWSDGKSFLQVVGKETLINDDRHYAVDIALRSREGEILPPGFYSLTGYLTVQDSPSGFSRMSAVVTFEIRNVH